MEFRGSQNSGVLLVSNLAVPKGSVTKGKKKIAYTQRGEGELIRGEVGPVLGGEFDHELKIRG